MNAIPHGILRQDEVLSALRETAMLATCRLTRFGLERKDRTVSEEVRLAKGVAHRGLRVTVNRLAGADEHHRAVVSLQEDIRDTFNRRTFYWDDSGWRGLPSASFTDLLLEIVPKQKAFQDRLREYEEALPQVLAQARIGLGKSTIELPDPGEIIKSYGVSVDFQPIPESGGFRGLPASTTAKLGQQLAARAAKARTEAVSEIMGRIGPVMERMVERLNAFDERNTKLEQGLDPGREGIFRDSLVSNVQDLAQVLPSFAVLGDTTLRDAVDRVTSLASGITPDKLREDKDLRNDARAKANDILDLLAAFKT